MIATTIRTPPLATDFVPLTEFQSQTPESFVDGTPVLHLHMVGATASAPKRQVTDGFLAIFPADTLSAATAIHENGADVEELVEQQIDVYVTSEKFIILNPTIAVGVCIPYPSVSIHALKQLPSTQQQAVWMQLELADGGGSSDDEFHLVELTIIPPPSLDTTVSPATMLFEAMSACGNLHPDPAHDGDEDGDDYEDQENYNHNHVVFQGGAAHEALTGFSGVLRGTADGGLPPPMPGSGGWITAENVGEYFDEEGRWIGPGAEAGEEEEEEAELGLGAGRTRTREEDGVNDHEEDESKRQRVD